MIVEKGQNISLFTAIGKKASMGKSLDYYEKDRWEELRPVRKGATKKVKREVQAKKTSMQERISCEQDLDLALLTWWESRFSRWSFERNLDSIKLRNAIARFCEQYDLGERERYYTRDVRREMYKKLNKLFPSRGPGSSKSPENYNEDILLETLNKIWLEF